MIKPSIGRKVYYFVKNPDGRLASNDHTMPFDVNIVYVWSDNLVNVAGFDHNGNVFARTSVPINVEAGGGGASAWCEWMPYQVGQAKANEAKA